MKSIIFDYGGTLDTDARHWAFVLWEGFIEANVPVSKADFCDAYVFAERALAKSPVIAPTDDFHTLLRKKADIETQRLVDTGAWHTSSAAPTPEALEAARIAAVERIADYCNAYALRHINEARPLLEELSRRYRLVLVSNFYGNIAAILKSFGIAPYFSAVIESAVVGVRKPDPAIYRMGVEAAGVQAAEVTVVGDSYSKDIMPAKSIGCRTVWMKGDGWNDFTADLAESTAAAGTPDALRSDRCPAPAEKAHNLADHIISTLADLRPLLLSEANK